MMEGRIMKKIGFILTAFVMASLASCQKEATNNDVAAVKRSFEVSVEETKTSIGGGASVVTWAAGDKIDVYGYTDGQEVGKATFTISEGIGGTVAKFTIDDGQSLADFDEYYAVYPSGKALKTSSLPASLEVSSGINGWDAQTAVEGSYDPSLALMTAVANGEGKLVFRHGVAFYRIRIPADDITKVKVSFSNNVMQKRPVYDTADGSIKGANSGHKELAISGTLVKDSYYYLCAVPKRDGTAMGTITVTYTQNSVDKAVSTTTWKEEEPQIGYLYDLGCPPVPVVPPAVSADNVTIEADETAGSIVYNVTDAVPGGAVSAEITAQTPASWLTLGADSGTAIAFTCAANDTENPKTATVRITYTYDTDKTVYKDITVTQKAAAGGAAGDSEDYVWDFSSSAWTTELSSKGAANADLTSWTSTVDGLTWYSKGKSKWNTRTINSVTYTYIQAGGAYSDANGRVFTFTVNNPGTLTVITTGTSGTADETRMCTVKVGDADPVSKAGGSDQNTLRELTFSIPAGEVSVYPTGNALRFFKIEFHSN